jgi:hypothetical protein
MPRVAPGHLLSVSAFIFGATGGKAAQCRTERSYPTSIHEAVSVASQRIREPREETIAFPPDPTSVSRTGHTI